MNIIGIKEKIATLKRTYKKVTTNFYSQIIDDMQEVDYMENDKALVFVVQESYRKRVYFAAADNAALCPLLQKLPKDAILEYIHQESVNPLEDIFINGDMERYKMYIRTTTCYSDNPYKIPEEGRRKLLEEMYVPNFGEYAKEEHAVQLQKITKETFDVFTDDIFTLEEWKKIIANKECIVYCEEGEIIAYYVYRLEGKKLYSNISVNKGPANYLYNIERRVFEEMWKKGIRIFYAWVDVKNAKQLKRRNKKANACIKSNKKIYNFIYIKK